MLRQRLNECDLLVTEAKWLDFHIDPSQASTFKDLGKIEQVFDRFDS